MTLYSRKRGLVSSFDSVNRVYCISIAPLSDKQSTYLVQLLEIFLLKSFYLLSKSLQKIASTLHNTLDDGNDEVTNLTKLLVELGFRLSQHALRLATDGSC